ncbi:hypothetical protein [Curtobacterium sp. L1-20]|uniref:hypothetical protein n=1 Tax=Curtobacterium sp. L1-20 TaxID=3138181 RepID=UPI003B51561E
MARDSSKLTIRLSPEVVSVLRDLADSSGSSMTDVVKKAISDRKYFSDKLEEGNEIILQKPGESTRTIVDLR